MFSSLCKILNCGVFFLLQTNIVFIATATYIVTKLSFACVYATYEFNKMLNKLCGHVWDHSDSQWTTFCSILRHTCAVHTLLSLLLGKKSPIIKVLVTKIAPNLETSCGLHPSQIRFWQLVPNQNMSRTEDRIQQEIGFLFGEQTLMRVICEDCIH